MGAYVEPYWERWQAMGLACGIEPGELALRFAAYTWGIDSCIVGSTNVAHLQANVQAVSKGRLPDDVIAQVRETFRWHDRDWIGQT